MKKLKIGIDVRTAAGEKDGKGWYTFLLVENLLKLDNYNEYILYTKAGIPAFAEYKNAQQKIIESSNLLWHQKVKKNSIKEDVDVFFAPSSYIIPSILPKKIKSIVTVHDLVALLYPKNHSKKAVLVEKLLLKKVVKKSAKILTVSKNTKADLLNKFDMGEDKIDVIYCSASNSFKELETENLINYQKQNQIPSKFFLAVGTVIPRKNYQKLVQAFALVHKTYPEYHLLIVGKEGWGTEKVLDEVEKNYLDKHVHFLDYVSQSGLINLYNLATAFVFPSLYEGFGIPPLEAMKCGCPVIASNRSSVPEVVGKAAILVDPNDQNGIAQAMKKFITDAMLRESFREKGLKQAQNFSWRKSAEKLLEIINTFRQQTLLD
ncbi:glycosyltransferase family 4 protein [Patescibacteria group bacterium]